MTYFISSKRRSCLAMLMIISCILLILIQLLSNMLSIRNLWWCVSGFEWSNYSLVDRRIQNLLIIVFKTVNNYPPEYLRDLFRLRDNIKNLRGVNKLQVPKPNTTRYGKNSVKYLAAITWNKISDTLRFLSTLSAFKKAVRQLRF